MQAKRAGHALHTFQLGDYGIPYGYSPLIAFNENSLSGKEAFYKAFLKATGEGYAYAAKHTDEAASAVQVAMTAHNLSERDTDLDFLKESQKAISGYYNLSSVSFGLMEQSTWERFVGFLEENELLKTRSGANADIKATELYTNALLGS